ncbi:tyrosine-protein phosphatase non-receptor type 18-like [Molossus nigricans]
MADTYAVVQKRRATSGSGPRSPMCSTEGARSPMCSTEGAPIYSQVMSQARRPQARAEETQGALPGGVPADPGPTGPGAYEDVASGSQAGGLGFNLRIGRPKGPRDPPAEWTRV